MYRNRYTAPADVAPLDFGFSLVKAFNSSEGFLRYYHMDDLTTKTRYWSRRLLEFLKASQASPGMVQTLQKTMLLGRLAAWWKIAGKSSQRGQPISNLTEELHRGMSPASITPMRAFVRAVEPGIREQLSFIFLARGRNHGLRA